MGATIEDRARCALTDDATTAEEFGFLLADIENALQMGRNSLALARERAVRRLALPESAPAARAELAEMEGELERREALSATLKARQVELKTSKRKAEAQGIYAAALAERDEVAELVRDRYPVLAAELAEIARRIRASDAAVERANAGGAGPRLEPAEAVGRGVPGNFYTPGGAFIDRIANILLPSLDGVSPPFWSKRAA